MFESFSIKGFRGITELAVDDLKRVNVFVGKNNCGKTSILEGLYLGMCVGDPAVPYKLLEIRELKKTGSFFLNLVFNKMNTKEKPEIFLKHSEANKTRTVRINYLQNIHSDESGLRVEIRDGSNSLRSYDLLDYGEDSISTVGHNVTNINIENQRVNILTTKDAIAMMTGRFDRIQYNKQLDTMMEILKKFEPRLTGLYLSANDLVNCDVGFNTLVPLNFMGDGMVRTLAVALAVADSSNGTVFIDEIENGLHYSSLGIMWKAVLGLARKFNVQVFATTHSYEALRALAETGDEEDDIRVFRRLL